KVEGAGKEETEQQILYRLRFGGYAVEFPPSEETFATENKFPFHYTEDESDEESDGEAFDPLWEVPDQLVMPKTKKLHAIIEARCRVIRNWNLC
ncbi:hypothetical protein F441_19627, partial [Phytophthora nicotianae CJ01A1]